MSPGKGSWRLTEKTTLRAERGQAGAALTLLSRSPELRPSATSQAVVVLRERRRRLGLSKGSFPERRGRASLREHKESVAGTDRTRRVAVEQKLPEMMQTIADLLPNKAAKTLAGSAAGVGRAAEVPPAAPQWLAELEGQPHRAPRHLLLQAEQGKQRGQHCPLHPSSLPAHLAPSLPDFLMEPLPHHIQGKQRVRLCDQGFCKERQGAEKKRLPDHPVHSPKAQL